MVKSRSDDRTDFADIRPWRVCVCYGNADKNQNKWEKYRETCV